MKHRTRNAFPPGGGGGGPPTVQPVKPGGGDAGGREQSPLGPESQGKEAGPAQPDEEVQAAPTTAPVAGAGGGTAAPSAGAGAAAPSAGASPKAQLASMGIRNRRDWMALTKAQQQFAFNVILGGENDPSAPARGVGRPNKGNEDGRNVDTIDEDEDTDIQDQFLEDDAGHSVEGSKKMLTVKNAGRCPECGGEVDEDGECEDCGAMVGNCGGPGGKPGPCAGEATKRAYKEGTAEAHRSAAKAHRLAESEAPEGSHARVDADRMARTHTGHALDILEKGGRVISSGGRVERIGVKNAGACNCAAPMRNSKGMCSNCGMVMNQEFPPAAQPPAAAVAPPEEEGKKASKVAATASLHTEDDEGFAHAQQALEAAPEDPEQASKFHKRAAARHEIVATNSRSDGEYVQAHSHDQAAALHRKAASIHSSTLNQKGKPMGIRNRLIDKLVTAFHCEDADRAVFNKLDTKSLRILALNADEMEEGEYPEEEEESSDDEMPPQFQRNDGTGGKAEGSNADLHNDPAGEAAQRAKEEKEEMWDKGMEGKMEAKLGTMEKNSRIMNMTQWLQLAPPEAIEVWNESVKIVSIKKQVLLNQLFGHLPPRAQKKALNKYKALTVPQLEELRDIFGVRNSSTAPGMMANGILDPRSYNVLPPNYQGAGGGPDYIPTQNRGGYVENAKEEAEEAAGMLSPSTGITANASQTPAFQKHLQELHGAGLNGHMAGTKDA